MPCPSVGEHSLVTLLSKARRGRRVLGSIRDHGVGSGGFEQCQPRLSGENVFISPIKPHFWQPNVGPALGTLDDCLFGSGTLIARTCGLLS
ncbi:hypothetical protein V5799_018277 [Amblyomma americanum]|uniref:Uncharacterized protein n=1 Tax=Amblyomma americanum TaxID=6943 RepID=A0AAQ4F0Y9_AMBAM